MPPLNIYRNTTLMSNSTRASTFAPYFELTPSLTERPLVFTLIIIIVRGDIHPDSPAAPRRSKFTNINTAMSREAILYAVHSRRARVQISIEIEARLLSSIVEHRTHLESEWSIWTESFIDRFVNRSNSLPIPVRTNMNWLFTSNLINVYIPIPFSERIR